MTESETRFEVASREPVTGQSQRSSETTSRAGLRLTGTVVVWILLTHAIVLAGFAVMNAAGKAGGGDPENVLNAVLFIPGMIGWSGVLGGLFATLGSKKIGGLEVSLWGTLIVLAGIFAFGIFFLGSIMAVVLSFPSAPFLANGGSPIGVVLLSHLFGGCLLIAGVLLVQQAWSYRIPVGVLLSFIFVTFAAWRLLPEGSIELSGISNGTTSYTLAAFFAWVTLYPLYRDRALDSGVPALLRWGGAGLLVVMGLANVLVSSAVFIEWWLV